MLPRPAKHPTQAAASPGGPPPYADVADPAAPGGLLMRSQTLCRTSLSCSVGKTPSTPAVSHSCNCCRSCARVSAGSKWQHSACTFLRCRKEELDCVRYSNRISPARVGNPHCMQRAWPRSGAVLNSRRPQGGGAQGGALGGAASGGRGFTGSNIEGLQEENLGFRKMIGTRNVTFSNYKKVHLGTKID